MSHIRKQTVRGFDTVHPVVLQEGIKVAAQLLALQGVKVTDFVFNWSGQEVRQFDGMTVICGLGAEGAVSSNKFGGLGLAVDNGKLAIVGDFYHYSDKERVAQLRKQLETVLGGSCYFAARAMIATAKGQRTQVKINHDTNQLQLVVQM